MEKNFWRTFYYYCRKQKICRIRKTDQIKLGLKEAKILSEFQLNIGVLANTLFGWLIPALRMATRSNIESISSMNTVSNEKIKSRLNYQFIPLSESIDFHLNNYINDKKIKQMNLAEAIILKIEKHPIKSAIGFKKKDAGWKELSWKNLVKLFIKQPMRLKMQEFRKMIK
jgi:hypothetical protein